MNHRAPDVFLPPLIVEKHDTTTFSQTVDWANRYHKASDFYGNSRGENAVIFVLDTAGTFEDHQDLAPNNPSEFNNNFTQFPAKDLHGHGTHCAGIAAAVDNGIGVIGIAPAATLGAVKVLGDNGSGYAKDIAAAIRWVADLELTGSHAGKQKIISGSLGGSRPMPDVEAAINYALSKNVWVIFAAGNSGYSGSNTIGYPANYDKVIAVGSIKKDESPSSFSSGGPNIDVAAYGDGNYSTYKNNSYATLRGTSMATPVVSGIAALLAGEFDWLEDQDDLMNAFRKYAKDLFDAGFDHRTGYGTLIMNLFENEQPEPPDDEPDEPSEPEEPQYPSQWQDLWIEDVFSLWAKRQGQQEFQAIDVKISASAQVTDDTQIKQAISNTKAFFNNRAIVHRANATAKDFLAAVRLFYDMLVSRMGVLVKAKSVSINWKGASITEDFDVNSKLYVKSIEESGDKVTVNGIEFIKLPTNTIAMEKFGIEGILAGKEVGLSLFELYEAVYLDDKKINGNDLVDLVRLGPAVATDLVAFVNKAKDLGKEWDDLSDEELDQLDAQIDEVVEDPNLRRGVKALIELSVSIDRYAESKQGRTSR